MARINRALGLDEPVHVQYWRFLKRIFELDLGTSTQTGQPVWDEFALRFPATVELGVAAILIAVAVGIPMGYLAAKRRGRLAGCPPGSPSGCRRRRRSGSRRR
ncbi:hypothetical protein SBADM41S_06352 [Streptomyces badius]